MSPALEVRLAQHGDYLHIVDYFTKGSDQFLEGMGVDRKKLPEPKQWLSMLYAIHDQPDEAKSFFYLIWLFDGEPIGHSNINKIRFGEEAFAHLHMWNPAKRHHGYGLAFMKKSIPCFFEHFKLERLFCEPYALNPAPNKTLPRLGFKQVGTYEGEPGWISFHQPVNTWLLSRDEFEKFYVTK